MYAITQQKAGSAQTLCMAEIDRPEPRAHEVLVKVHAAGVNRADIAQREGHYPPPPGASPILGLEVAGEVVALGAKTRRFSIGDAVFGLVPGGGYAQYVCMAEELALYKPAQFSFIEAASLPEATMTAWLNLVEIGRLAATQRVCIHAGASGVGLAAIQLAKLLGAYVMTTVGSPRKVDMCRKLGADMVINYTTTPDFASAGLAPGGVDLVLDCVGGSYLAQNIKLLNRDGHLVVIAFLGGRFAELDFAQLLGKRLTIQGSTLRNQPAEVKARLTQAMADRVVPRYLDGTLQFTIDRVFPWREVQAAHLYMESNQNIGKIILDFSYPGKKEFANVGV